VPLAERLADALRGVNGRLMVQWVREPVSVERSPQVVAIAEQLGVRLDLTPMSREMHSGMLTAYDDLSIYRPMRFDIRIPGDGGRMRTRMLARRLSSVPHRIPNADARSALFRRFDEQAEDVYARLQQVLDRDSANYFRTIVNSDPWAQSGTWERYHVFNWAPPLKEWFSAVVFNAAIDLASAATPLREADINGVFREFPILKAREIPVILIQHEDKCSAAKESNLALQVAEHSYLINRREPSPDSSRLVGWFPQHLGQTLEIGCGFGVLAEKFIERTDSYVGIDLTVEQGRAIVDRGGAALVADFHELPFAEESFDTVIADNVIEHALDPAAALREIRRILRKDGSAYLVLPLDFLGPKYRNLSHHWKADEASIRSAVGTAGLRVARFETHQLAALAAHGSFPSCAQTTSLWHLTVGEEDINEDIPNGGKRSQMLDFRAELAAKAPTLARAAKEVTEEIIRLNSGIDFTPLERRSPGLKNFAWPVFLRLSELRIVRALDHLRCRGVSGQALDVGSYFGNTALTLARGGWHVTAVDSYSVYRPAFDKHMKLMRAASIDVRDFDDVGFDLAGLPPASFDAVLCMGVIEHVPHTPRLLLEALDRVLKPGGWLILDTPNLAYQFQRNKLSQGESVFPPIEIQYESEIPFEGHHREYIAREVEWVLSRLGHVDIQIDMFNFSLYGLEVMSAPDLRMFEYLERNPSRRELIMSISCKPKE
jgi:SAM-dependent methyltransferase